MEVNLEKDRAIFEIYGLVEITVKYESAPLPFDWLALIHVALCEAERVIMYTGELRGLNTKQLRERLKTLAKKWEAVDNTEAIRWLYSLDQGWKE